MLAVKRTEEPSHTVNEPLRLSGDGEAGTLDVLESGGRVRFLYAHASRGSCTFLANLRNGGGDPLHIEQGSVCVESYRVRTGNLVSLLQQAEAFFGRKIEEYDGLIRHWL